MKMTLGRRVDATQNSIFRGIITYTMPLIISALIQNCFDAVDLVVLGNVANESAVASVGATSSIVHLCINLFIGVSNGAKMIMSRLYGEKNIKGIKTGADTMMLSSVGFGLIVSIVAIIAAPLLLRVVNCPPECFDGAVLYIRVYLSAAVAILIYNFGASIIMASGDSQRPLVYVFIGGISNVLLNIVLCFVLTEKVAAVAISTAAAQVIMAALVLHRLFTMEGEYRLDLKDIQFHIADLARLLKHGIPIGLSSCLYPLANLTINSELNLFGVASTAGNSAGATIDKIFTPISTSFPSTALVFMGQNMGAKKYDRVQRSFWTSLVSTGVMTFAVAGFIYITGEFWCSLILPDSPEAVSYAMLRMKYITLLYFIYSISMVLGSAIQSYGYSSFSAITSIFAILGVRLIWMFFVYPNFRGNIEMIYICYSLSWAVDVVLKTVGYTIFKRRFYNKLAQR